jgi:prophage DNA circulation protein
MTLAEAAATTGRPAEAIRAMIRRGKLKATKGNDGRYLVAVPAELRRPPGQPDCSRSAERGQEGNGRLAALQEAVEEWRAAAEDARLEAAVATAERDAAKATAAVEIEAMRRQTGAELAAKDALVTELRAMLAEARRPFWRRWFGASA